MKLATIEIIRNIEPIIGADNICLASVLGYKSIIKKDSFKVSDKIVFIFPDTVLPFKPWAEFYKSKSNRVKCIRLKGVWSEGIIEDIVKLGLNINDFNEGDEVSNLLEITKFEVPLPKSLDAKGNLPYGLFKTDEERFQNIDNLPFGEEVIVTLKIDGQSGSYYSKIIDNNIDTGITSRSLEIKPEGNNNYTKINHKYNITERLKSYCLMVNRSLCIRGEIFGGGVQLFKINPHSLKTLDFEAFNIYDLDNRQYIAFKECADICSKLEIPLVPIIEIAILTPELIKKYREDLKLINNVPFEGVVVKGNSFSFKIINAHYDTSK